MKIDQELFLKIDQHLSGTLSKIRWTFIMNSWKYVKIYQELFPKIDEHLSGALSKIRGTFIMNSFENVWRFIRISFERPKYSVSRVRFSKV